MPPNWFNCFKTFVGTSETGLDVTCTARIWEDRAIREGQAPSAARPKTLPRQQYL